MEQNRRRGTSFHEDMDDLRSLSYEDAQGGELSYEDDGYGNILYCSEKDLTLDIEADDDDELPTRGRARSQSRTTLEPYNCPGTRQRTRSRSLEPPSITIPNCPPSLNISLGEQATSSSGNGQQRSLSNERVPKSGPLTPHEVDILKRGLEDATLGRNSELLREEEEEILVAREEEQERLVQAGIMPTPERGKSADSYQKKGGSNSSLTQLLSKTTSNNNANSRTPQRADQNSTKSSPTIGGIDGGSANSSRSQSGESANNYPTQVAGQSLIHDSTMPETQTTSPQFINKQAEKYTAGGENQNIRRFKVLMLGDSGVGKTSLIFRWTEDRYLPTLVGTIGVNFKGKKVNIDGETVQVQVWDTAGQEQFHTITTSYYRGAHAILVVYDLSERRTLDNVAYWIENIKKHAAKHVEVALIGNKSDLRTELETLQKESTENPESEVEILNEKGASRSDLSTNLEDGGPMRFKSEGKFGYVETTVGEELAKKFDIPFFETSAKDATGTDEAFLSVVKVILGKDKQQKQGPVNNEKGMGASQRVSFFRSFGQGKKDKTKKSIFGSMFGSKEKQKDDTSEKGKGALGSATPSTLKTDDLAENSMIDSKNASSLKITISKDKETKNAGSSGSGGVNIFGWISGGGKAKT